MFIEFRNEVEHVLEEALASYDSEGMELTESEHADISSRIAFSLASKYKRSPKSIADEIVKYIKIPAEDTLISNAVADGPYINFFVNDVYLHKALQRIKEGIKAKKKEGKIIIEHTSANPDGPLHIGHLRNAIIGDGLARILKRAGYEVETQYYVNDMGRQIAVVVWGAERMEIATAKKADHAVVDVYIAANRMVEEHEAYQREIEDLMGAYESGDEAVVKRYETVVNASLSGIKATLERLNIHHDLFVFESEFVREGAVEAVVEELVQKGNIKRRDGAALLLHLDGIDKELVIRRTDGTLLYTTRDLAYHRWKSSRCDRLIDVFGKDHELVSKQLTKALELMGVRAPEFVIFAFVSLPTGSVSTRAGRYISADELISKIEARAYEEVAKRRADLEEDRKRAIARKVGIGALRYDMVKVSPEKHIVFVFEDALNIEKKGAPFIQYSYARACSILRAAEGLFTDDYDDEYNTALREESEKDLIKKLAKFEYIVQTAALELKLHLVAKYARELAEMFNAFYKYCPVLNAEQELRGARLQLVYCTKTVLGDVLDVLGIEAPDVM